MSELTELEVPFSAIGQDVEEGGEDESAERVDPNEEPNVACSA